MNIEAIANLIGAGKAVLGIELGSTRIKAVLIGEDHSPIASGDHTWENRLENGVWTYHLDDVWAGIQDAYANLVADVLENPTDEANLARVREQVAALTARFPVYK